MGKKNLAYPVLIVFVFLAISGCGTAPKKYQEDISGIKTRVETLESRVEGVEVKQAEVERIASERAQSEEMSNIEIKPRSSKSKERTKEIQAALKNAGFYTGKIDGVKGKNTRKAIMEFQRENGLVPDGIVGNKTWEPLARYAKSFESPGEYVK